MSENKPPLPWYENTMLKVSASWGLTIALTIAGAYTENHGWLLVVAAGCFTLGAWIVTAQIKPFWLRSLSFFLCLLLVFAGLYWGDSRLHTANAAPASQAPQKQQSNSTAGNNNTSGNIDQSGTGNNAVIGSGNNLGNTTVNNEGNITVNHGPRLSGWLIPASLPFPSSACPKPKANELALYMGTSVYLVDKFPATVINVAGIPRLVLEKGSKGIAVTTDIFDDTQPRQKIIASIERNQITVNPNNYFKLDWSKDGSQLRVVDQYKDEVLNIHYLNKNAISLTAILRFPGVSGPVSIKQNEISWEGIHIHGGADCYPTSGGADLDINRP